MNFGPETKVAEILAVNPAVLDVFEQLGIDYCCGGSRTLGEACAAAHVSPRIAAGLIEKTAPAPTDEANPSELPSAELMRHIVDKHHRYVRDAAPRLATLLTKAAAAHGERHPEVAETAAIFQSLERELASHMLREEAILFPALERMGADAPERTRAAVAPPIRRMMDDHDDAGELLARMSALTGGYTPPTDACATLTAAYRGLAAFERDLHLHIHLENNVLFPRFRVE